MISGGRPEQLNGSRSHDAACQIDIPSVANRLGIVPFRRAEASAAGAGMYLGVQRFAAGIDPNGDALVGSEFESMPTPVGLEVEGGRVGG